MTEKQQFIINAIKSGETQIDIAKEVGLTRERVRQIWNKYGTTTYKKIAQKRFRKKKKKQLKVLSETVRFYCRICYKPTFVVENGKKTGGNIFCKEHRGISYSSKPSTCDFCDSKFYPKGPSGKGDYNIFCKRDCYNKFRAIFKKSPYHYRLLRNGRRIKDLKITIRRLQERLALKKSAIKRTTEVKHVHNSVHGKKAKTQHGTKLLKDKCQKCGMLLIGEFKDYRSKINTDLCYDCEGTKQDVETSSFMSSGLIKARSKG